MANFFDNTSVNDTVTIRHNKNGKLSQEYTGTIVGYDINGVTLETSNGYRSFRYDKMTMARFETLANAIQLA